ncbi:MAG: aldehyde dehydrogenase family protein, partial [Elusimicrobiota bacterium]
MPVAELKTTTLKQFVSGRWVEGRGDREILSLNPADTNEIIAVFKGADRQDALAALDAAERAWPAWKKTPAPKRGRIVQRALEIARSRVDELARLLTREEGKILGEARGEVDKGMNLMEWYAGEGMRLMGQTAPSELPSNFLYT